MPLRIDQIDYTSIARVEVGLATHLGLVQNTKHEWVSPLMPVNGKPVHVFFEYPTTDFTEDRRFPAVNISFITALNADERLESKSGGIILSQEGSNRLMVDDFNLSPYDLLYRVTTYTRDIVSKRELDDHLLAAFPIKGKILVDDQYWLCLPQNRNSANHYNYDQGTYRTSFDLKIPIVTLSKFGAIEIPVASQFDISYDTES